MPERERQWCAEAKRMNPSWEFRQFGNEVMEKYGRDVYVREMMDKGSPMAFVTDRIRVLLLKEHGGIWLDPDCQPIKPLDSINIWDGPQTFMAAFRSPDRPEVALHRGVSLLDNTFLASAPNSRMINRLISCWTPKTPVIDGHGVGVEILRSINSDCVMLNHRYFYALQQFPETICLHDAHNLGSWCSQRENEQRKRLTHA